MSCLSVRDGIDDEIEQACSLLGIVDDEQTRVC